MNKFLQSSANPQELSLTVRGILVSLVAVIIMVLQVLNIPFSEAQLMELIQQITALLSVMMVAFGLARKIWYSFK